MSLMTSTRRPRSSSIWAGTSTPARTPEAFDEAVGGGQADGQVQLLEGYATGGFQQGGGVQRGPGAEGKRGLGIAHGLDLGEGGAALGEEGVFARGRRVETLLVSGSMIEGRPKAATSRLISVMSEGSTQPGRMLIDVDRVPVFSDRYLTNPFTIALKPVTWEPTKLGVLQCTTTLPAGMRPSPWPC